MSGVRHLRENHDITIETAGQPPIHTTSDVLSRAAANLSKAAKEVPSTSFAKEQLRSIIERVERLEEEKKTMSDDIKDVYAEAKGNGFDVKALRTIVRMRKEDPQERQEAETILETYMQALGML